MDGSEEALSTSDLLSEAMRLLDGQIAEDPTMRLAQSEKDLALQIQAAVEADERVQNLSDLEYVQYALTTRGQSLIEIRERVYLMQCFRDQYQILDTATQGIQFFYQLCQEHPGLFLAVDYLSTSENYIFICDYKAFDPTRIQTDEQYRIFLGVLYYNYQLQNQNVRAMRNGVSFMVDCMDASFTQFNPALMEKCVVEIYRNYPMKQKEWFFVNSNTIANMTYALWKRFLPPEVQKTFQLGHQVPGLEGARLDTFYNTPTPEAAQDRMCNKYWEFLNKRYHNQQTFSLDTCSITDSP